MLPHRLAILVPLAALLAGCSSSFGSGGGGAPPAKTYIIEPNGQVVPATGGSPAAASE